MARRIGFLLALAAMLAVSVGLLPAAGGAGASNPAQARMPLKAAVAGHCTVGVTPGERISFRGCHGSGKETVNGWIAWVEYAWTRTTDIGQNAGTDRGRLTFTADTPDVYALELRGSVRYQTPRRFTVAGTARVVRAGGRFARLPTGTASYVGHGDNQEVLFGRPGRSVRFTLVLLFPKILTEQP